MKKRLLTSFFLLALSIATLLPLNPAIHQAQASGTLRVKTQNGVMYVSSESDTPDVTVVQTDAPAGRNIKQPIVAPRGFATDIGQLINFILRLVMIISLLLVFAFLIIGGIEWITSGGEKGKTDNARNRITSALIGLIVLASSYAILTILLRFLGFGSLTEALNNVGTIYSTPTEVIVASPTPTPSPSPSPTPSPTPGQ